MTRFTLALAACAMALCLGYAAADEEVDYQKGYATATRAMRAACWYEYLKILPTKAPNSEKFQNCYRNLDMTDMVSYFKKGGHSFDVIKISVPPGMQKRLKKYAPANYHTSCSSYVDDPDKTFSKDYSAVVGDGSEPYKYRGLTHCIMAELEKDKGLEAVQQKWNSPNQPWVNAILDRENENRERHGSPQIILDKELNARAQKWADKLAAKCAPLTMEDHIQDDNPEAFMDGKQLGESIAQVAYPHLVPPEDQAIQAANSWYEEIGDYPWPEYKGKGNDKQFEAIGHFTASVWKGVQKAGYGLGKRDGCEKTYIVARYWPGGNMPGKFGENILPPKY